MRARPHACSSKAFRHRPSLDYHVAASHTKVLPFTCDECGHAYPTKAAYSAHALKHVAARNAALVAAATAVGGLVAPGGLSGPGGKAKQ
jgi:hypothetical protein